MKKNYNYLFLALKERNGEYEYTHRTLLELPDGQKSTANRFANNYAKKFYGVNAKKEGDGYFFHNREIYVEVYSWKHINEEEYRVLRQYI